MVEKKKAYWIVGIIVLLLVVGFLNYRYIQSTKQDSYIQGGTDAINQIINITQITGGVILEQPDNNTIILARYDKNVSS